MNEREEIDSSFFSSLLLLFFFLLIVLWHESTACLVEASFVHGEGITIVFFAAHILVCAGKAMH